jgi:hypothetical protein
MKSKLASVFLIILISSCVKQNRFPEKVSHRIPYEELNLEKVYDQNEPDESILKIDFTILDSSVYSFESNDKCFDLTEFENSWKSFVGRNELSEMSETEMRKWVKYTGLLLELTGQAIYAEELERIFNKSKSKLQSTIAPFILTKNTDHIFVNLFEPVEINYTHTMGGEVNFREECDYPKSGSVKLHFGMTERQYIELFIRIPAWAEGATVTVKQVKYFAPPGGYCQIAKKWKDGDSVAIEFPIEKMPR